MSNKAFLKSVFQLSISCFGGAQAHLVHYQRVLVEKNKYISLKGLFELYSLCQMLPGPTSTQTLTAVGYRLGGSRLAYLTLVIWVLPSMLIMMTIGLLVIHFQIRDLSLGATRFLQPMAVSFVGYAAYTMSLKTVRTRTAVAIMIVSGVVAYLVKTPLLFPVILIGAGLTTTYKYKKHPKEERQAFGMNVRWGNLLLWLAVLVAAALIGGVTKALPIRLFENFYRNGSLIFGGGQVLAPLLYTEFVQYPPKQYLTSYEFLSGYAFVQAMPGPLFSFSAYVGALSMKGTGVIGEVVGAFMATAGIFLPGTLLLFFMIRIWDIFKKSRFIKASLEGISAANAGLMVAAAISLFQPLDYTLANVSITVATFCLLMFSQLPFWAIIGMGLGLGFVVP